MATGLNVFYITTELFVFEAVRVNFKSCFIGSNKQLILSSEQKIAVP